MNGDDLQGGGTPYRGTAIVTGGRRGIGAASAIALAQAGYDLAIVDVVEDDDAAATLAAVAACQRRTIFLRGDIAALETHEVLIDAAEQLGPVTCLVDNAGVNVPVRGDMLETTPEVFDHLIGVNLRGTYFLTQAVAQRMVRADAGGRQRAIVVISSANAAMVSPEKAAYCISKSALSMTTKLFATRLAPHGIDVFEIQPGLIRTEMSQAVWETYGRAIEDGMTLTRRWGQPEDVGKVIAALAVGILPYCTGSTIPVGGGLHVHRL